MDYRGATETEVIHHILGHNASLLCQIVSGLPAREMSLVIHELAGKNCTRRVHRIRDQPNRGHVRVS